MFRLLLLLSFITLFSCASKNPKQTKHQATLKLRIGTSLLSQGLYPQALAELLSAEKLDPENAAVQNNLALAYLVRDKVDLALVHVRRALELKPDYSDARNNYGHILTLNGQAQEGIEQLKQVLDDLTYATPEKTYANLGYAYFTMKDYSSALEYYKKSLKIRRESCSTFNYYSRSLFELKQFQEAATSFDHTARLCQKNQTAEPRYYGALSYFKIGNWDLAKAKFLELVNDFPENVYAKQSQRMLDLIKEAQQ
ncbi:MAG: hypothetical protein CL675_02575 [Bdellovibrionaceae bacterium]|nr:hypothetical protein [Pseudobdellovibrionaceae bacterium]|tara:strand:- start:227 stop:988 length:762 start_codon:yes stop_codon:yes gene_type:complete